MLPDEAVTVFAELTGLDEKALRDDPNVGLDGLMEMIEAWMEVNNLENFIIAARTLARRVRAGMTGHWLQRLIAMGLCPGYRQAGAAGGLLHGRDRQHCAGMERTA